MEGVYMWAGKAKMNMRRGEDGHKDRSLLLFVVIEEGPGSQIRWTRSGDILIGGGGESMRVGVLEPQIAWEGRHGQGGRRARDGDGDASGR